MSFYAVCARCGRSFGKSRSRRLRRHLCFDCLAVDMMRSVLDGYPYPRQAEFDFYGDSGEEEKKGPPLVV